MSTTGIAPIATIAFSPWAGAEVVLAVVLAVVAWRYAALTKRLTAELHRARRQAVGSTLVLYLDPRSNPDSAVVAITNAGPGTALRVWLTLTFTPIPGSAAPAFERVHETPILVPGASVRYRAPRGYEATEAFVANYRAVSLVAIAYDVDGRKLSTDESLELSDAAVAAPARP
jgi:hypothetical protein